MFQNARIMGLIGSAEIEYCRVSAGEVVSTSTSPEPTLRTTNLLKAELVVSSDSPALAHLRILHSGTGW
jgi:hypothetical protein